LSVESSRRYLTAEAQDVRKNPQRLTVECIYRRIVKFRARAEL
jgi:hypothetical protein